jgi:hypothetical protein
MPLPNTVTGRLSYATSKHGLKMNAQHDRSSLRQRAKGDQGLLPRILQP